VRWGPRYPRGKGQYFVGKYEVVMTWLDSGGEGHSRLLCVSGVAVIHRKKESVSRCCRAAHSIDVFSMKTRSVFYSFMGFPQVLESPWIFCFISGPGKSLKTDEVFESPWILSFKSLKILQVLTNVTAIRKGWKLYCRFWLTYLGNTDEHPLHCFTGHPPCNAIVEGILQ